MGDKNSGRTTTVNTFCSKRKELSHSNNQISLPVMINMEELTYVYAILKKLFSKQKILKCAPAGRIKEFLPAWKLLTKHQELFVLVEGYQLPFLMEPVQEKTPKVPKWNQEEQKQVDMDGRKCWKRTPFRKFVTQKGSF